MLSPNAFIMSKCLQQPWSCIANLWRGHIFYSNPWLLWIWNAQPESLGCQNTSWFLFNCLTHSWLWSGPSLNMPVIAALRKQRQKYLEPSPYHQLYNKFKASMSYIKHWDLRSSLKIHSKHPKEVVLVTCFLLVDHIASNYMPYVKKFQLAYISEN